MSRMNGKKTHTHTQQGLPRSVELKECRKPTTIAHLSGDAQDVRDFVGGAAGMQQQLLVSRGEREGFSPYFAHSTELQYSHYVELCRNRCDS